MKRVLIFSLTYYPRFVGGAEVAIKEITERIAHTDIEFHMVTLRFDSDLPKVEKIGNVVVHRIGFATRHPSMADLKRFPLHLNKHWFQISALLHAEHLHRIYRYNAIWAIMAHSCAIPAGLFKWEHPQVKYVLTLQEGDPPEYIEAMMRPVFPLFRNGFRRADAVQAISTFLARWGESMGYRGEATVIPNGVDIARFSKQPEPEALSLMKEKLGKQSGDTYLVTTSRLVHKNAIDDVIRALPLLPENISFLIYGIGPDEEKLRALAQELGVQSRVRFMGHLSHEEMPIVLNVCDIFIRPSRSEGMGNSFIEAMAAGVPVIATQEGGLSEFIFDAKRNPDKEATAWAVDADSPEQIAAAVKEILADKDATSATVARAKALALEKYDWNIVARDMRALFEQVLGAR